MNEYQALLIASANSGKSIEDILFAAQSAGHTNEAENKLRFQSLHDQGYIEGAFVLGLPVTLTLLGADRLEQLKQEIAEASKKERQQRFNNKVAIAQILVPLITFILGLLVEHFTGIVRFAFSLFG